MSIYEMWSSPSSPSLCSRLLHWHILRQSKFLDTQVSKQVDLSKWLDSKCTNPLEILLKKCEDMDGSFNQVIIAYGSSSMALWWIICSSDCRWCCSDVVGGARTGSNWWSWESIKINSQRYNCFVSHTFSLHTRSFYRWESAVTVACLISANLTTHRYVTRNVVIFLIFLFIFK